MTGTAFGALLDAASSPENRERLHQARRELELGENDALWGLVQVVQDYCTSLGPPPNAPAPAAAPTDGPWQWVFRPWQLVSAALAFQTGVLALAFFVGRNWGHALPADAEWLRTMLSVPAGWMMFLHIVPLLVQGVASSWIARKHDRIAGWLSLSVFAGALFASAVALCWLLY